LLVFSSFDDEADDDVDEAAAAWTDASDQTIHDSQTI